MRILFIQTAYIGDVILSLPAIQKIKSEYNNAEIDYICVPKTSEILKNNPYINNVIIYDKRNNDKGIINFLKILIKIRKSKYDIVISPHRFLRSTLISTLSGAKKTISFENSVLSFLYKYKIPYKECHEIVRNLHLLRPLNIFADEIIRPEFFYTQEDINVVNNICKGLKIQNNSFITIAPGSVWFTKRFPSDKMINLINKIDTRRMKILLLGGKEDFKLCNEIIHKSTNNEVYNYAGKLSIMQSAELIKRSKLLLTNDTAPLHIANASGTAVFAFFGPTIRKFGFYPYGEKDKIYEINNLECRPCSIHGGNECPLKHFKCMNLINEEEIASDINKYISSIF